MTNLKVEKRDGGLEEWNYDKALLSIGKSMMPIKKAQKIASKVEKWASKQAKKGVITSIELRDKIISVLKKEDPIAADSYELYKKS